MMLVMLSGSADLERRSAGWIREIQISVIMVVVVMRKKHRYREMTKWYWVKRS